MPHNLRSCAYLFLCGVGVARAAPPHHHTKHNELLHENCATETQYTNDVDKGTRGSTMNLNIAHCEVPTWDLFSIIKRTSGETKLVYIRRKCGHDARE